MNSTAGTRCQENAGCPIPVTFGPEEMGRLKEIELKGVEEQDIKATAKELGLDIGTEALVS